MKISRKRSSLVLMELIVSLLFFSVVSALCVKVFLTAHLASTQNQKLAHAVTTCQSVAEVLVASNANMDDLLSQYPSGSFADGYLSIPLANGDTVKVTVEDQGLISAIDISYFDSDGIGIYNITTKKFTGGSGDEQ